MIDALDARILLALDDDPDATVLGLSRTLRIARNTVQARLRRLSEGGVLRPYSRRVDPAALGYPITGFLSLSLDQAIGQQATQEVQRIPQVIEVHAVSGAADLLVKVVARDTGDLLRLANRIAGLDGVQRSNTAVSLVESMAPRYRPLLEVAAGPVDPS